MSKETEYVGKREIETQAIAFLHWCENADDEARVPGEMLLPYGYALGAGWIDIRDDMLILTTIGQLILDNNPKASQ